LNIPTLSLLLLAAVSLVNAAPPRIEKAINRDWIFQYFPAPEPDAALAAPSYDDRRWPAVALPHTWSTYETTRDLHPFIRSTAERDDSYWWYGWGWYRKHITIGKQFQDRLIAFEFDGVQKYSKIYFNGNLVAEHKGGYTSFSVDVTKYVRFGEPNLLAVQVSNRRDDSYGRIPPMTAGNFDVYGGIYRDVRLVIRDRLHVPFQGSADYEGGTFVTTPQLTAQRGTVNVRTWVRNEYPERRECTLVTTVKDAAGNKVAEAVTREWIEPTTTRQFTQTLGPVTNPHLWSPESPYLYSVATEVRNGARLTDTYRSPLGFRWYQWKSAEKRLYLNGSKVLLHGINRHQEYPWLGDAMPKWMHERDLEDIRHGMGLNFQRTAHYPQDPYVYDLCDRLGFILIEESPNIKDIAFGKDVQQQNLKEMIRRDRNHPSIFIWSIGNETNQPADSAWAREEDTSRIVYLRRGSNGGNFVELTDKDLSIENLLRCTTRGWYSQDDRDFGPDTRNPSSGQVTGTEWWQHETCVRSERLADDNVVVWLYADHGADREYVNSPLLHVNPKGWTDAYRFPKYVYYLWQANYTSKPMAFIQPHYWREQYLGQRKSFVVDSNCDEVMLKVNGATVGSAKPTPANNHSVIFENVEVRRGTISVEGRKGAAHVQYAVTMAGKPARLLLKSSPKQISADRSGIAVLSADVVDASGVHVYGASPEITWTVSGPATLAGPAVYRTDTEKKEAMEGTLYIDAPVANVLRSTATAGRIRVTVSAPGLEAAQVEIVSAPSPDNRVAGIVEPPLADAGRVAVARDAAFRPAVVASKPSSRNRIAEISKDYDFQMGTRDQIREQIQNFIKERNPKLDTFTAAYRLFVERMTTLVMERNGHLVRDDYNFNARAYAPSSTAQPAAPPNSRDESRRRIRSTLFVPDPLPDLQTESYGQFEPAPGVVAERISYATAYGLRVPAIVYRPKKVPAAKMPALIVVNGHGGDKYSWYSYYAGILYAQAGAAVLTYDPIGEGERNAQRKNGTRQHDRNVDPPEMARRMGGLMITDVMQAVSYLAARPDVDAKRIAAAGYSMGSFVLDLAGAVETRLNSCVLVGGGNLDGEGGYWDSSSKKMCQGIPYQSLQFLGDRGAVLYDLHADRGRTLILNGAADDVVSIPKMGPPFFDDLRKRTIALHGSDRNVFDFAFEEGGGHRPYFLTRKAALWLHERLKFPGWTAESIAKMPETHISEWAARNGVPLDRLYATELREGGTRALGSGVPAVPHDLMSALPLDRWERDKQKYIYETWVEKARSQLAQ
jgi:beta-galactosidase